MPYDASVHKPVVYNGNETIWPVFRNVTFFLFGCRQKGIVVPCHGAENCLPSSMGCKRNDIAVLCHDKTVVNIKLSFLVYVIVLFFVSLHL